MITVLHNQSLLDISVQHTGTVENCFEIAVANGLSVTEELTPGVQLIIPESVKVNKEVLNYYTSKNIRPATAITKSGDYEQKPEGISYWIINQDFIVQ